MNFTKGKKVMIFDDDVDTLSLCSIILSGKGYDVHTSENSNDIITKVKKVNPDLILMDNWIPDKGGIEATRLLKGHKDLKTVPIIFFSANNEIQNLAKEAGADTYLSKPFDITYLEELVEKTIGERVKAR